MSWWARPRPRPRIFVVGSEIVSFTSCFSIDFGKLSSGGFHQGAEVKFLSL